MPDQTAIEWTDYTVNFWEGCQKVGPGCDHCYAEARDIRFTGGAHWGPGAQRRKVKGAIAKLRKINRGAAAFRAEHGRPPRVFCSSLADIFDNAVPAEWRQEAFAEIYAADQCRFQLLTKRVGNAERLIPPGWHMWWPAHVGLMITVVNQAEEYRDIPKLFDLKLHLEIPWVGLSIEPMLGPINFAHLWLDTGGAGELRGTSLDWVICGGESGPDARPMHPDWARSLRDQCKSARVPFLFKQWGEWGPDTGPPATGPDRIIEGKARCAVWQPSGHWLYYADGYAPPVDQETRGLAWLYRLGKKANGRALDGELYTEFPAALS